MRDMCIIARPPADRLAIRTFVFRFDRAVLGEAIRRELGRGGQVFFVHNRVESIHQMEAFLKEQVPEARFAVAHGQMAEGELEKVMVDFVDGKFDVLVCTTIIECGPRHPARQHDDRQPRRPVLAWPSSTRCAGASAARQTGPTPTSSTSATVR